MILFVCARAQSDLQWLSHFRTIRKNVSVMWVTLYTTDFATPIETDALLKIFEDELNNFETAVSHLQIYEIRRGAIGLISLMSTIFYFPLLLQCISNSMPYLARQKLSKKQQKKKSRIDMSADKTRLSLELSHEVAIHLRTTYLRVKY